MLCHVAQMSRPYSSTCKFSNNTGWFNLVYLLVNVLIHFEGSLVWFERQLVVGISIRSVSYSGVVVILLLLALQVLRRYHSVMSNIVLVDIGKLLLLLQVPAIHAIIRVHVGLRRLRHSSHS